MKLCECGCGEETGVATKTESRVGIRKGENRRFVYGHHNKALPRSRRPPAERFWEKVEKRDVDDCWPWTARITKHGYGQFRVGGKGSPNVAAHRFAYEDKVGPIPDGLLVCHTCDNPPCCNPGHLFLGTPAQNSADMVAKGRQSRGKDHPNHGRPFAQPKPEQRARGERNAASRLDAEKVREIRRLAAEGVRQVDLAERFGIAQPNISKVVRRQTWAHVG